MEEFINTALTGCIKELLEKYKDKLTQNYLPLYGCLFQGVKIIKFYGQAGLTFSSKALDYFVSRKDISKEEKEEFLLWLKDFSEQKINHDKLLARVAKTEQWELFSRLSTNFIIGEKTSFNLARYGGKEMIRKYLPCCSPEYIWLGAIKRKEKEFYNFLFEENIPAPSKVLCAALEEEEIELIKRLVDSKVSCFSTEFASLCVKENNLEMFNWAFDKGCPMNKDVIYYAKENTPEDILFYLAEKFSHCSQ